MTVSPRLRKLLPLMAVSFSFFAAAGSLSPFLSLHLRTVGLSDEEAVLVTTAAAFASLLGPVLVGLVAERRRAHRPLLVLSLVLAGAGYSALLAVPPVVRSPRSPLLEFDCPSGLYLERCPEWESCTASELNPLGLATFRVSNCHYQCGSVVRQPIHFCFLSHEGNLCIIHEAGTRDNSTTEFGASFLAKTARTLADVSVAKFLEHEGRSDDELVDVCSFDLLAPIVVNQKQFNDYECRPHPEGCAIRCSVAVADNLGRRMQSARCTQVKGDPQLTFWATLALRVFADLWLVTAFYLVEAVTVLSINDFTGLYGRIKFWAALGVAISAAVTGVLVDHYSEVTADYSPAIFMFDGLALVSCALAVFLPAVEDKKVSLHYGLGEEPRFCSLDASVLFLLVLVLGTVWGYLETYLHWMYSDMGATHVLVALSLALPMGCALPFLAIAKNLVRNIGRANLIVFGFLFYATRAAGLSFVTARWWITPFEAMETFTLPVLWVALVAYAQKVVPSSQRLTIQCILVILHFCVGRGTGTIAGFFLNATFGQRTTVPWRGRCVCGRGPALPVPLPRLSAKNPKKQTAETVRHARNEKRDQNSNNSAHITCCALAIAPGRDIKDDEAALTTINGGWYPMQNSRANGDTPAHRPMMGDQDDSDTGGFEDSSCSRRKN
ncbi:hypothetical protein HPB50_007057 [Hyalomma asiaticum]|uniref:Uncharacterized protein n=1 Tax=Hyalomma asiaticum TaxID=266040 RepID=A0ACB7SNJ9_HYAAI|nr:hypothetical protein HPB50_007057 [Hyalomma asiaticum]